ncbi:MAG: hypothetical protein LBI79_10525 [Nitrososphaerota archaeon]|jgi:hypothetical protein|nr:hypothetical protein [Nitrososphaerota archaeon]
MEPTQPNKIEESAGPDQENGAIPMKVPVSKTDTNPDTNVVNKGMGDESKIINPPNPNFKTPKSLRSQIKRTQSKTRRPETLIDASTNPNQTSLQFQFITTAKASNPIEQQIREEYVNKADALNITEELQETQTTEATTTTKQENPIVEEVTVSSFPEPPREQITQKDEEVIADILKIKKQDKKDNKEDKEKQYPMKACGYSEEGYYESIYLAGKPIFAVYQKGEFKTYSNVKFGDQKYAPITDKIMMGTYKFPEFQTGITPLSLQELYDLVYAEFKKFLDLEDEYIKLEAICTLFSYLQDKANSTPYLYHEGDNESGKTVTIGLHRELDYRPLHGQNLNGANIYQYYEDEDCIPTICEDELTLLDKDNAKMTIYKGGYQKGAKVPRIITGPGTREMRFYPCFGLKYFASEDAQDPNKCKGFNERCIFIAMTTGYPEKDWGDIDDVDRERWRYIRNQLLLYRLSVKEQKFPSAIELNLPANVRGRFKELWLPILQTASKLSCYDDMFRLMDQAVNNRLLVRQKTLEYHIVKCLNETVDAGSGDVWFETIWDALQDDLDGEYDDKQLKKQIKTAMETVEFGFVSKKKVGDRLGTRFNGCSEKRRDVDSGKTRVNWHFNVVKLNRIIKKYGVIPKLQNIKAKQTSIVTVVTNVTDVTDITRVTDNSKESTKQAITPTTQPPDIINPECPVEPHPQQSIFKEPTIEPQPTPHTKQETFTPPFAKPKIYTWTKQADGRIEVVPHDGGDPWFWTQTEFDTRKSSYQGEWREGTPQHQSPEFGDIGYQT